MLSKSELTAVVNSQASVFSEKTLGVEREKLVTIQKADGFVTIICGIRRCGKSTIAFQLVKNKIEDTFCLNFEDTRLSGFSNDDFRLLDILIKERNVKTLFFDEIQVLPNWELFVRTKLDEGFDIIVTGSNATLLSKELGTKLTGRHLQNELFPFSFTEYLTFKNQQANVNSLTNYLKEGGMPEYLKSNLDSVLRQLLDDILYRDIAVRYELRDIRTLRQLAVYLISNIGKPVSATGLKDHFGLKSPSTILEYFSYLENAYIVQFLPMFSYSLKQQIRNPKKVYAIDMGLFTTNSIVFTEEKGRRLENVVYLHLRRMNKEIFYFKGKKECDFIVMQPTLMLVQVCYELNEDNMHRETQGLIEAMEYFNVSKGQIVTHSQSDKIMHKGKEIEVIPAWEYLRESITSD